MGTEANELRWEGEEGQENYVLVVKTDNIADGASQKN